MDPIFSQKWRYFLGPTSDCSSLIQTVFFKVFIQESLLTITKSGVIKYLRRGFGWSGCILSMVREERGWVDGLFFLFLLVGFVILILSSPKNKKTLRALSLYTLSNIFKTCLQISVYQFLK